MIRKLPLLLVGLVLLGCPDEPAGNGDADNGGSNGLPSVEQRLGRLLGDEVQLGGPLAKLHFGMGAAAATEAVPGFEQENDYTWLLITEEYGSSFEFRFETSYLGQIETISVELTGRDDFDLVAACRTLWGEPVADQRDRVAPGWIWYHPEKGLKARVPSHLPGFYTKRLTFLAYRPLKAFLGEAPGPFGFEAHAPLLGLSPAELEQSYREQLAPNGKHLLLPTTEHGRSPLKVSLDFEYRTGVVKSFSFAVPDAGKDEEANARIEATIAAKLGEPSETSEENGRQATIYRSENRLITVNHTPGMLWYFRVTRPE